MKLYPYRVTASSPPGFVLTYLIDAPNARAAKRAVRASEKPYIRDAKLSAKRRKD